MKSLVGFCGVLMMAYLTGAFIQTDFNIHYWSIEFRAFIAFSGVLIASGAASANYNN